MTDPIEIMARAIVGQQADDILLAANPLGEPAEYPAWMLYQPDARRVVAALAHAGYAIVSTAISPEVGDAIMHNVGFPVRAWSAAIEAGRAKT